MNSTPGRFHPRRSRASVPECSPHRAGPARAGADKAGADAGRWGSNLGAPKAVLAGPRPSPTPAPISTIGMSLETNGRVAVEVPEDLGRPDHGPAVAAEDYPRLLA